MNAQLQTLVSDTDYSKAMAIIEHARHKTASLKYAGRYRAYCIAVALLLMLIDGGIIYSYFYELMEGADGSISYLILVVLLLKSMLTLGSAVVSDHILELYIKWEKLIFIPITLILLIFLGCVGAMISSNMIIQNLKANEPMATNNMIMGLPGEALVSEDEKARKKAWETELAEMTLIHRYSQMGFGLSYALLSIASGLLFLKARSYGKQMTKYRQYQEVMILNAHLEYVVDAYEYEKSIYNYLSGDDAITKTLHLLGENTLTAYERGVFFTEMTHHKWNKIPGLKYLRPTNLIDNRIEACKQAISSIKKQIPQEVKNHV